MKKTFWTGLLALLVVMSMVLSACSPAATTEAPAQESTATEAVVEEATEAAPAEEPTATEAAAEEPTAAATATEAAAEQPSADLVYEDVDPSGQEVHFWHNHTGGRQDALEEIVQEFNSTNEWGITVIQENQGGYGDIFNKMLPILNSPDVPGLVVAYQNQAATYQLSDSLVDMNSLVNSPKWGLTAEDQKDFFSGFFAQDVFPNFDNQRLGLAPNRSMEVLYYNMDWLKELGYDAPPATPDEFKEMACAATKTPFSKSTAEGSIGYELSVDASRYASWTFAFGGDIYDSKTGEFTNNSEAAVAALTFLQDLFKEGCATIVSEDFGDQTDFGAGRLLFTVGSSSGLPFYQSAVDEGAKFDWSIAAIPHTTAYPAMNIYGASVSIPKSTPEQELAAWLFVKYYTSADVQAKWAAASQYFPVRASVAEGLKTYFDENPSYKTAFDMLQYGKFEPPVPGYDFIRDAMEMAMSEIVAEPYPDVQERLDALNVESNEILQDQLSQMTP